MTDEELASLIQKGDLELFGQLMDRYTEKLFRYGKRFISDTDHTEDIVQDVFIKTYQNIQSFDSTRKFSSWIYRIAHNAFVNALRKKATEPIPYFDFDALTHHAIHEDSTENMKEVEEMRVLIEKGIQNLAPMYREVVTLYYFENLGYQEISDILEIPVGTVGIRLSRARAILRKHFLVHNKQQ
jgi:RNA polymerase sigma-70 factor (ECF subfamily)